MAEPASGIIASLFASNEGSAKFAYLATGFAFGIISMQFVDHMSRWQRVAAVITSGVIADAGAEPVSHALGAGQYAFGAAGLLGLFGFSLIGAAIKGINTADVSGLFKAIIDALADRIRGK